MKMLARKGDGIEVVVTNCTPRKVKDFTPYARKVVSSGGDAVITGNWAQTCWAIGKAIIDNGFEGPLYLTTLRFRIPPPLVKAVKDKIRLISQGSINPICHGKKPRATYKRVP